MNHVQNGINTNSTQQSSTPSLSAAAEKESLRKDIEILNVRVELAGCQYRTGDLASSESEALMIRSSVVQLVADHEGGAGGNGGEGGRRGRVGSMNSGMTGWASSYTSESINHNNNNPTPPVSASPLLNTSVPSASFDPTDNSHPLTPTTPLTPASPPTPLQSIHLAALQILTEIDTTRGKESRVKRWEKEKQKILGMGMGTSMGGNGVGEGGDGGSMRSLRRGNRG